MRIKNLSKNFNKYLLVKMKITPIKTLTPINETYLKHEFNAELARGLPFLALICFTMQLNEHIIQRGKKKNCVP